jgi:hypothetical protein
MVHEHQSFVKAWIENVILAKDGDSASDQDEKESQSSLDQLICDTLLLDKTESSEVQVPASDRMSNIKAPRSISNQSSRKPPNSVHGNDPEYLNDLITPLLRSSDESFNKYSNSVQAGVKSFFSRMDKDLKGSLRRHDVQDEFCCAIRHNGMPVPEPQLIGLVWLGD